MHRLSLAGAVCAEGWETRVWATADGQGGIKGVPIPEDLAQRLRS